MSDVDLEGVWADFSAGRIARVADVLGTTEERALENVGKGLIRESDKLLVGIWRYSFDVLAFACLVLLVLVFFFVTRQSFPHGKSNQVVITVAGGVPKYHVITDKDVALQNVKTIDGSLGEVGRVLGHYAIEPIGQGVTIQSNQLSSGIISASAIQGRQVLLLPIKATHFNAREMPIGVSLYLSPHTTGGKPGLQPDVIQPAVIHGAYILSCVSTKDSEWAAIALSSQDVNTIIGLLANSDIYVSEHSP